MDLDTLKYRALPQQTAADGHTWTPRVPREYRVKGTHLVVRVTGLRGQRVELAACYAHQALVCPDAVALDQLEEVGA